MKYARNQQIFEHEHFFLGHSKRRFCYVVIFTQIDLLQMHLRENINELS